MEAASEHHPTNAARAAVEYFREGESASDLKPGHIVLTHGTQWTSRLIRFGQRLRFRGTRRPFARWNHVALVLDADGNLGEALAQGVVKTNVSKYEDTDYHLVRTKYEPLDRDEIAAFAASVLDAPHRTTYGWVTIISLFFTLAFGSTIMFGKIGTTICSGFASEALVRAGEIFPRPPAFMMPADVAEHFGATGNPEP